MTSLQPPWRRPWIALVLVPWLGAVRAVFPEPSSGPAFPLGDLKAVTSVEQSLSSGIEDVPGTIAAPVNFECPKQNGVYAFPGDAHRYYRCQLGLAVEQQCGPRSVFAGKSCKISDDRWFCVERADAFVPLASGFDTVERCWREAVRRRSHYLSVGLAGCRISQQVKTLTDVPCTNTSMHVINVRYYQRDLIRLNPDFRLWVSGKPASGVRWRNSGALVSTAGAKRNSYRITECTRLCVIYGQDFSRVDSGGCQCGVAVGRSVQIRHEDLGWAAGHLSAIVPGFTIQLRVGNITGWMCTAAPTSFIKYTAAQTMQEALAACQRQHFQFLAAGKEGFFCGNNTANLERFSSSQCEMKLTKRTSYSIIQINEIERQITHIEENIREYIFWWVSRKAPNVFWTTLADVSSLEQCVLQCKKRFICVGADGCSCGSLRSGAKDLTVKEWVKKQPTLTGTPGTGRGYLLLDKLGSVNVPEGWLCATHPIGWSRVGVDTVQGCLRSCAGLQTRFMAIGTDGCFCGDGGVSVSHLAMARCQNPEAAADGAPYSVLFVDVWTQNMANYTNKAGYAAHWVDQKPAGVRWELAAGRTVALDCVRACEDKKGVKLVLVGVDGCQCGITTTGHYTEELTWNLSDNDGPARGFFLVERETQSEGYTAPTFSWVTKRNDTERKENPVEETPTWVRVNITSSDKLSGYKRAKHSVSETESSRLERRTGGGQRALSHSQARSLVVANATAAQLQRTRATNASKGNEKKQIDTVLRATRKRAKSDIIKNTVNETEKNFVSAQKNSITVGSNKRRLVALEKQKGAKESTGAYKLQSITGEQTKGTIEQYISGEKSQLVRLNDTSTKMLEKNVGANQTHLNASTTSHAIRRLNVHQSRATGSQESNSSALQIHIGGRCYVGKANRTGWVGPVTGVESPFKCLCNCVRVQKLFYAIYEGGQCWCNGKRAKFGSSTGSITTSGECPQAGARVVYNGLKHTQKLTDFCEKPRPPNSGILFVGNTKLNQGQRIIEFNNTDSLRMLKKDSKLHASHQKRSEIDTRTDLLRHHEKRGAIKEAWRSKLSRGLLARLFRLKLHVRREHNVRENVSLITKKDTRQSHYQHAPVFRPTTRPNVDYDFPEPEATATVVKTPKMKRAKKMK